MFNIVNFNVVKTHFSRLLQRVCAFSRAEEYALLGEDAVDIAAFNARAHEPVAAFEAVLKDLKRRGNGTDDHQ
ncbi:MAG TPA: hypothetical protein VL287_06145 [Gemmatimonadales bacterium]|jgi:hypothetical protein|nr:hypothetical protein [Gemmatimonadales bacterium]